MDANLFIVHPANIEQENALKTFFKAFRITFETAATKAYNQDFVNMVLEAEKEVKSGKGKKVTSEEFDALWK